MLDLQRDRLDVNNGMLLKTNDLDARPSTSLG
jgi:hypothetical protein